MKKYVSVYAEFDLEGHLFPVCICWEDGRFFPIDRILDIRQAASLKSGGCGLRYTCRIANRERYLFLDENRWFIETAEKPPPS